MPAVQPSQIKSLNMLTGQWNPGNEYEIDCIILVYEPILKIQPGMNIEIKINVL